MDLGELIDETIERVCTLEDRLGDSALHPAQRAEMERELAIEQDKLEMRMQLWEELELPELQEQSRGETRALRDALPEAWGLLASMMRKPEEEP